MVSANTKTKRQQKQVWNGSQGAQTSAVIKFLSVLTSTQGDLQPTGGTHERLEERLPGETKSARRRNMWSSGKDALNLKD
jgi:hypothetical protein